MLRIQLVLRWMFSEHFGLTEFSTRADDLSPRQYGSQKFDLLLDNLLWYAWLKSPNH